MLGWQAVYTLARKSEHNKEWQRAIKLYSSIAKNHSTTDPRVLYRLGNCLFNTGKLADAVVNIRAAIAKDPSNAAWHYRMGFILEKQKNYAEAVNSYELAIQLNPHMDSWYERLAKSLTGLEQLSESPSDLTLNKKYSLSVLQAQFLQNEDNATIASLLATKLRSTGNRWQEIEVLEKHAQSTGMTAQLDYQLAEAYSSMNRHDEAAGYYQSANSKNPGKSENYFTEGNSWLKAGNETNAQTAFANAIATDKNFESERFGIGIFFQKKGDWSSAVREYLATWKSDSQDAELTYRLALSMERTYDWESAERYYKLAIERDPLRWNWHFRHGFTLERQQKWVDAAESYRVAAYGNPNHVGEWFFRLGYALNKLGKFHEACIAFLNMHPTIERMADNSEPSDNLISTGAYTQSILSRALLGNVSTKRLVATADAAAKLGTWDIREKALRMVTETNPSHEPLHYYRYAEFQFQNAEYEIACQTFLKMSVFPDAHGIDTSRYKKDKALYDIMQYTSWTESLPLEDDVVFYETFHSDSIGCNPYAIYQQLRRDTRYSHLRHVWATNESTLVPQDVIDDPQTTTIRRNSDAYRRYLATAKYLVSNVTFHAWFVRRHDQVYLNTWHGTPIKTLGKDITSGYLEHKNVARNFLQASHIISGNAHTTEALTAKYDIAHILTAKVAELGYPRVDISVNMTRERQLEIKKLLSIDGANLTRPTVLYAPTWRGGLDTRHFDLQRLVADLEQLYSLDANILFQAHHYTEQLVRELNLPVTTVPRGINTNELLAVVDHLVTDYSSIAFDFLALNRPVYFYTYDWEEYSADRGLYFTRSELPGAVSSTVDELIHDISEAITNGPRIVDTSIRDIYCKNDDGSAASRAVEFFMNSDDTYNVAVNNTAKKQLLFHHSFIPNGITTSIQNLIQSLDSEKYESTVVVAAEATAADPLRIDKLEQISGQAHIIGRTGRQLFTPEEKWVTERFNKYNTLNTPEQWSIFRRVFEREFRRIFGTGAFDAIIEFEGYSVMWASILGAANSESPKSIYLHNDMYSEWRKRFQYLESMFHIYDLFDRMISVSPSISDENRQQLASHFGLSEPSFVDCINQINPAKTMAMANEEIDEDIASFIRPESYTFVTMGRLSPEKDHKKLLLAVAEVNTQLAGSKRVQIVILGDGPLKNDLGLLAERLGLSDDVFFGGLRKNPFPVLHAADAFVLSSNHEGQPMVLLEALIMGKVIVSTDIVGTSYVLRDFPESLVDNSQDGLVSGLLAAVTGKIPPTDLDVSEYVERAANSFLEAIILK